MAESPWLKTRMPLECLSIEEAAQSLQIHPSEVVRLLVQQGTFPPNLLLDPGLLESLCKASGIEVWWTQEPLPPEPGLALAQRCFEFMLAKSCIEPDCTRADNLFRGLSDASAGWLRRVANTLIREGILFTRMTHLGLMVGIRHASLAGVQDFVVHGGGTSAGEAITRLCNPLQPTTQVTSGDP